MNFIFRSIRFFLCPLILNLALEVKAQPPLPFPPKKANFPPPSTLSSTSHEPSASIDAASDPIAMLLNALASADDDKRLQAIEQFDGLGSFAGEQVTSALSRALDAQNPLIRHAAIRALGIIGQDAHAAIPKVELLANQSKIDFERMLAIWAIARMVNDRGQLASHVPPAIAGFDSTDETVVDQAARALIALGRVAHPSLVARIETEPDAKVIATMDILAQSGARAAVVPLTRRLSSDNPSIQLAAIRALEAIGPASRPANIALIALLSDSKDEVLRVAAARAMGIINESSQEVIESLVAASSDSSEAIAVQAIDSLNQLSTDPQQHVGWISTWINDPRPQVQAAGFASASELGDTALPLLKSNLQDPAKRYGSLLALGELGPNAKEVLPALLALNAGNDPSVRREQFIAVAKIGQQTPAVNSFIISGLQDSDVSVQRAATFAAGSIPTGSDEIVASLKANHSSNDKLLVMLAAWAIANNAPNPLTIAQSTRELLEGLTSADESLREAAGQCIASLKPSVINSPMMLPGLVSAMQQTTEASERTFPFDFIISILEQAGVGGEMLNFAISHPQLRPLAAVAVTRLGAKASPSAPALLDALIDDRPAVRRDVAMALAAIGPDANVAVDRLQALLMSDIDINVKRAAAIALGRIGGASKPAINGLRSALSNPSLSSEAAWALAHIDSTDVKLAEQILPQLISDLDADRSAKRREAAEAIAALGSFAESAGDALRNATDDSDPLVRAAAKRALSKL